MSQTKLTMRQIHELLRLKHQNQLSIREIARSCGLPSSTVGDYLKRAEAAGVKWPLPAGQSEKELLQLLIAAPVAAKTAEGLALPDWPHLHQELGRKSVTLMLLWQEYRQAQPAGYGYSRFCQLYQRWAGLNVRHPTPKSSGCSPTATTDVFAPHPRNIRPTNLGDSMPVATNMAPSPAASWAIACHARFYTEPCSRIAAPSRSSSARCWGANRIHASPISH
jgi:hypothetical protein